MSLISFLIACASQLFPRLSSRVLASSGYTRDPARLGAPGSFSMWTSATAERQDRAWQPIVSAAKAGRLREDVAALYEALESLEAFPNTIVEVGCGGGYNSEIVSARFPALAYEGIDISAAMIAIAQAHYPQRTFVEASAYELPFADGAFDAVLDGVALIHMPEWQSALSEYSRVAKRYVILHGLTLAEHAPTTKFAKYAYGQPAIELVFNRAELSGVCEGLGLTLLSTHEGLDYDLKRYLGIQSVSESWVLELTPAR